MFRIVECQPSAIKPAEEFVKPENTQVPDFWGGYVAIFAPGIMTASKFHTVYYFASDCKTLKKALHIHKVEKPDTGWRWYRITLKHDKGRIRVRNFSDSQAQAIKNVLAAEGAPESAIVKVEELKTK